MHSIPFLFLLFIVTSITASPALAQTFNQQMSIVPQPTNSTASNASVAGISDGTTAKQPAVVLGFDDDWPGQYWYVRPLLEKYGANATFWISCTAVGDVIREEQPQFMMSWKEIQALHNDSFNIESHGLTHADLTALNQSDLVHEVRDSKTCIQHHLNMTTPITIFGNAFARGGDNQTVVDVVSKYYDFARSGYSNTTYLGCDGWYAEEKKEPADCRVLTPNGTMKYEHRYNMHTSSHNELDRVHMHDTAKIMADFKNFLHHNIKFNDDGSIQAMPIITYHNIANLNQTLPQWYNSTTLPETLEAELKYMNESGIRMLSTADLVYDNATNKFHIREGI